MTMRERFFASEDPPEPLTGAELDRAPDAFATDGGVSGFSNELPLDATAFSMVVGGYSDGSFEDNAVEDLGHLQELLEREPRIEKSMRMVAYARLRQLLLQVPMTAKVGDQVTITIGDAVVLARLLQC